MDEIKIEDSSNSIIKSIIFHKDNQIILGFNDGSI
jgi:hypothetical protein